MSTPTVVLFDVDGTLIDSGGAGARSWKQAFDLLYGIPADIGSHTSAGETDPVVARKTFEAAIGRAPSGSKNIGRPVGSTYCCWPGMPKTWKTVAIRSLG